ncbi:MAG: hypothetical protein QMC79_06760 [Anaerosomatales bacterium]|nr:hypothetical protein [Anaerosomatales bacterium]
MGTGDSAFVAPHEQVVLMLDRLARAALEPEELEIAVTRVPAGFRFIVERSPVAETSAFPDGTRAFLLFTEDSVAADMAEGAEVEHIATAAFARLLDQLAPHAAQPRAFMLRVLDRVTAAAEAQGRLLD